MTTNFFFSSSPSFSLSLFFNQQSSEFIYFLPSPCSKYFSFLFVFTFNRCTILLHLPGCCIFFSRTPISIHTGEEKKKKQEATKTTQENKLTCRSPFLLFIYTHTLRWSLNISFLLFRYEMCVDEAGRKHLPADKYLSCAFFFFNCKS